MEIQYKEQRDKMTGLKILENDNMIKKFILQNINDYKRNKVEEEEISFKEIRIKIKGNSLHPVSATKINIRYPKFRLPRTILYAIPKLIEKYELILLPKSTQDLTIYNVILANNDQLLTNEPLDTCYFIIG